MPGRNRLYAILLVGALLALQSMATRCRAQLIDDRWSALRRLSDEKGRTAAAAMVSDPFGYLHAFWIQSQTDNEPGFVGYARLDETGWSDSIPIAVMKDADSNHRCVTGAVDRGGVLHVVWNSGMSGPTNYSRVAVLDSTSAPSWSWPISLGLAAYRVDLQVDANQALHLLYTQFYAEPGVYYVRSSDGGDNWTAPVQLDPDIPEGQAPYFIYLRPDEKGGLHALWHYYVPETARGKSIRYARSLDGGESWSKPVAMADPGPSGEELWKANPTLAVSGDQVHAVWPGGVPNGTFRVHRFSTDRGEHWSAPERILGHLHGEANGDGMAVDARGRVHWVGQVRYPQAVYHAYWDEDHWSPAVPFYMIARTPEEPIGDRIHAHNVRLGIRAGNQLVASFTGIDGPSVLCATERTLGDVDPVALAAPRPPRRISPQMWGLVAVLFVAAISTIRHLRRARRSVRR